MKHKKKSSAIQYVTTNSMFYNIDYARIFDYPSQ